MNNTPPALNDKQRRFVAEYLVDLNATRAAIHAGYSPRTAKAQGSRLLTHVDVASAIAAAQQKRAIRTDITADRVLRELATIAFGDVRRLFDEHGNLRSVADLDDETAAALASIEVVKRDTGDGEVEYVHKVKQWDKTKALEMIARHLGMFVDRQDITSGGKRIGFRMMLAAEVTDDADRP